MSSSFFYFLDQTFVCPVCLSPWMEPVEVKPCGHICCRLCQNGARCFECGATVISTTAPNRALVNMLQTAEGRCSGCSWVGEQSQFPKHLDGVTHLENHVDILSLVITDQYQRRKEAQSTPPPPPPPSVPPPPQPSTFASQGGGNVVRSPAGFDPVFIQQIFPRAWGIFSGSANGATVERNRLLRLTRYLNLCVDTLGTLQAMGERISQAQYLQWAQTSQRNPLEQYNVSPQAYINLMGFCHRLDVQCLGVLTQIQCRQVADAYVGGRVTNAGEWSKVLNCMETLRNRSNMPDVPPDQFVYHHLFTAIGSFLKPISAAEANRARGSSIFDKLKSKLLGDERPPPRESQLASTVTQQRATSVTAGIPTKEQPSRQLTTSQRILRMLRYYSPETATEHDELLRDFAGQEDVLLASLIEQFGSEPTDTS